MLVQIPAFGNQVPPNVKATVPDPVKYVSDSYTAWADHLSAIQHWASPYLVFPHSSQYRYQPSLYFIYA